MNQTVVSIANKILCISPQTISTQPNHHQSNKQQPHSHSLHSSSSSQSHDSAEPRPILLRPTQTHPLHPIRNPEFLSFAIPLCVPLNTNPLMPSSPFTSVAFSTLVAMSSETSLKICCSEVCVLTHQPPVYIVQMLPTSSLPHNQTTICNHSASSAL